MRIAALIGICSSLCAGCGGTIEGYALSGDRLLYYSLGELISCPLDQPGFVGAQAYAPNPSCELILEAPLSRWSAGDRMVAFQEALSSTYREDTPVCRTAYCVELSALLLEGGAVIPVAPAGPTFYPSSAGDWVLWLDTRDDHNGLCSWPAGDDDCAVDLYGFDRRRGTERRLTPSSTVLPADGALGYAAYSSDGTRLAYVDRGDAPAVACGGFATFRDLRPLCETSIRVLDLETGVDRRLSRRGRSALRPTVAEGAAVWLELTGPETAVVMYSALTGTASEAVALFETTPDQRFDFDGQWIVQSTLDERQQPMIEAIHPPQGERRRLSQVGEAPAGPLVRRGKVVWRDLNESVLSLYELENGRRRVLLEVE